MNDALFTHRDDWFRYELLDSEDLLVGPLDGVEGGRIDYSIYDTIRSGGNIAITPQEEIDWMSRRVKVWYGLNTPLGPVEWPLGVFLPATPKMDVGDGAISRSVELYDKLLVLHQDAFDSSFTAGVGDTVTDVIRSVIQGAGESNISITNSAETLSSVMFWPAGESKLRVVNDLLAAINYFSLWCDGHGQYRAEPYKAPANRPVAHTFADDEMGLYLPQLKVDEDSFDIPNKIIGNASTPEAELVSVATNTDPSSPFSYSSRGNRWITRVLKNLDATSQSMLDEIVAKELSQATQQSKEIEAEHAWLPLDLNNAIRFVHSESGTDALCTIVKRSVALSEGGMTKATFRRVA